MKNFFTCIVILYAFQQYPVSLTKAAHSPSLPIAGNIIIVTTDGFRWQEVFKGPDSTLLANEKFTPGGEYIQQLYWSSDLYERRKKLLPFIWNIVGTKGQLYGNRIYDSKVNTANPYALSYPGYSEIFTGITDIDISSNRKTNNPNINIFEMLQERSGFEGSVAVFTSWDVFPFILNSHTNQLPVNSGYKNLDGELSAVEKKVNQVQNNCSDKSVPTRNDQLTFIAAKEYLRREKPRVMFIGFGETDEFAHEGRYDLYLQQASKVDQMIAELWHWIQTTPGYKDNTFLLITTDHGRGKMSKWTSHGQLIRGSSQTWLALMGPGIPALGEIKERGQLYQVQLAKTITGLLGEKFEPSSRVADAITLN